MTGAVRDLLWSIGELLNQVIHFLVSVLRNFRSNNGIVLAAGVGYNSLLSIVPLFIVLVVALSHFFDQQYLVYTITHELQFVVPGHADRLAGAVASFVEQRDVVGGVVLIVLLFFSSIAFRTFEAAMEVIFETSGPDRHFLVSVLLPYGFIAVIGLTVIALTTLTALLDMLSGRTLEVLQFSISIPEISGAVIYVASFLGSIGLFTALYKVVPATKISTRRAAVGAVFAAVLWEIVRRLIVWYFANIAMVNVVYGSLTTLVLVLITMEIASVIILLGAQVIAELERHDREGHPWYGDIERLGEPESRTPPEE